jgi:hypothetical protein
MKWMNGRRGEVEISNQGNEGDRMQLKEDQNEVLVFTSRLIYIRELALKRSCNYA